MIIRIFDYGGAVDIPQHDDEYKTQPNPTKIVLCHSTLSIITVIIMEIIKTCKGGEKLVLNGETYTVKKKTPGVQIRWSCSKAKRGCKGAVTTNDPSGNARNRTMHNHGPSGVDVELAKFRSELRDTARQNTGATTSRLLLNGLQNLSVEAVIAMPIPNTIKRDIQRQKAKNRPIEPQTILDIILAHPWTSTGGAQPAPFLIYDNGPLAGRNRIIVFAADEPLMHLATSDTWFMDGTFKGCPIIFKQLYVIRAMLDDGAVSCVYAYIPGKERRQYTEVFVAVQQRLQALGVMNRVRKITVDFEQGAYEAFKNVFGQHIEVNGCFFHLKQSTFRYAVDLGLRQFIVDGSPMLRADIRTFVGMVDALAFLPIGHLNLGVIALYNSIPDPVVRPLLDYFVSTYIFGQIIPNSNPPRRSPPMFHPNMWNQFLNTLRGEHRTNNICEGWNHAFNILVGERNPKFYKSLDAIQKDYALTRRDLLSSHSGQPLKQRVRRASARYNSNITELCIQYRNHIWTNDILGYLRKISHNVRY